MKGENTQSRGQLIAEINRLRKEVDELRAIQTERTILEEELQTASKNIAIARQEAANANRLKGEFVANVTHEIRTPMNGVLGMMSVLMDTNLTAEQLEYARIIQNSANSLMAVINEILDFSSLEAQKLDLDIINFDLHTTLEGIRNIMEIRATAKDLKMAFSVSPDTPTLVRGDPGRLRQILHNLIGNAIKFTHKGHISLEVTPELSDSSHDHSYDHSMVRFSIKDTGIGFPTEKIDDLFQAFTQADGTYTRKYGGTGLGLAISKQLVEMMGGTIGVTSNPGKGSTFWFTIRLEIRPQNPPNESPQFLVKDFKEILRGKRILVVDGNKTNRMLARRLLKSYGCINDEAGKSEIALEKLRAAADARNPFHVALLDMKIRDMDGEALGKIIKNNPQLQDTILIMLTSVGKRGDANRMEQIGFDAYLTKPFKQSLLMDCISMLLLEKPENGPRKGSIVTRHSMAEKIRQNARVLLVEDDKNNRNITLSSLHNLGYHADIAENGRQALDAFEQRQYDIILVDFQMQEMDGFSTIKEIRNNERKTQKKNHTPIIAMTAHIKKKECQKCIDEGMDDYISKPVDATELSDALYKWNPFRIRPMEEACANIDEKK